MERQFLCTAEHQLAYREFEPPALAQHDIRIKPEFGAAKHGTEMSFFKGYGNPRGDFDHQLSVHKRDKPANPYPFYIGNMVVGRVAEIGQAVTRFNVGDRALAYSGFSTCVTADENTCWKLPDHVAWQSAVCIDPADFAFSAIRDGQVRLGDAVAVFSLGAIGLMAVQLLQLTGAHPIIACDPIARRRELAAEFGATLTLDPTACDAGLEIRQATRGRGADVVIEYSGTRQAMQDALRGVAFGGNVVAGAYPPPYSAGLDLGAESHMNIPNLIFSRAGSDPNRDHPRWNNDRIYACCYDLILQGKIKGEQVIWPVVSFDELATAYPKIADDPASTLKLGVRYEGA
jgi:threonine dehydrogenase-like Zn-dependent dehydrogenase